MSRIDEYIRAIERKLDTLDAVVNEADVISVATKWEVEDVLASLRYDVAELLSEVSEDEPLPPCGYTTSNPVTLGLIVCEREAGHTGAHASLSEPLTWR